MQEQVSYTVNKVSWMGAYKSNARANAVIAKANAKARASERALQLMVALVDRRQKACVDALADPILQRRREHAAMRLEDRHSRQAAEANIRGEKRKAEHEHEALLRSSSQYRENFQLEKITKKKEQAVNVAAFYENRKRKAEQQ